MYKDINLPRIYARALRGVEEMTDDSGTPRPLPAVCPYALDDLLAERPDIPALVARLNTL